MGEYYRDAYFSTCCVITRVRTLEDDLYLLRFLIKSLEYLIYRFSISVSAPGRIGEVSV